MTVFNFMRRWQSGQMQRWGIIARYQSAILANGRGAKRLGCGNRRVSPGRSRHPQVRILHVACSFWDINAGFSPSETSFKNPAKGAVNRTEPLSNSPCDAKTILNLAVMAENTQTPCWTLISGLSRAIQV